MNVLNCDGCNSIHLLALCAMLWAVALPAMGQGQALGIKHPVLDHRIDPANAAGYEKAVEHVMAMSEEEMLSYVPDKPFSRWCYCPNCHGGSQGNGIYEWSIDRPDELKCKYCGMVFPNDQYPDNQIMEGKNALGETITYRYHQDQKRDDLTIFIRAHILMHKRSWIMRQCSALARAYHATGKKEYARRVVLILDRTAQVYPHYPVMQHPITSFLFAKSQAPPFAWNAGRWGNFHNEIPKSVIWPYDLVYESEEFDKLSQERGYDVREKLENDFLKVTYEAAAASKYHVGNVVGYDVTGVAILGLVINEPAYVHRAFGWMKQNVDEGFFYDGMWHEAPSYHYMTMGGLRSAFNTVRGYSDPPGYVDEVDGTRFDDLDPEKQVPFLARCINAPSVLDFPNGCSSTIHDTWANERRSKPRTRTVSAICPGYGHASLGRGEGLHQMQAQLHFSGAHGHAHSDNLNLSLFAKEREMLCDIGYTHTKLRNWTVTTVGHNLVAVDRKQQTHSRSDGDLLAFFPDANGVAVVEADGKRAYANIEGLDMYRRMLVTVPVSDADAYVVDLFRVRGGTIHDWLLHGSANHEMTAECSVELAPGREDMLEAGDEWQEPRTEGSSFNPYGVIREVAAGKTDDNVVTTFAYVDEPDKGVRVHLLGAEETEVYLGRSPSVRQAGSDSTKAYDYWMPQLLVRRSSDAPLAGVFAAVEEPYSEMPFISSVEPVALTPPDDTAVALRVTHGDTIDTIISTLDEPPYPERATADGITIKGRLGIIRQVEGKTAAVWLFDGVALTADDWSVKPEIGSYAGAIVGATRKLDGAENDAFITDADLPEGDDLHELWMIVTHGNGFTHGYSIERVEKEGGKTVIVLSMDHGLRIQGHQTQEVYFPRREIEGANSFAIPLAVTMVRTH